MSYLQEEGISRNRLFAIIAVGVLHAFLAYALITGLAIKAVKSVIADIETVNIEEQAPPPDEPPPPPPKLEDIPPYVPPPDVVVETSAPPPPTISTQSTIATPEPPRVVAPPVVVAPPAIPNTQPIAVARTFTVSADDYPDASRRAGEEGVTGVRVTIGVDGRVSACSVTRSSNFPRLDEKACQIAQRRWRFKPATANGQPVEATISRNYRWQLQEGL